MANQRLCSIENCCKPARARGYCTLHWQRWRKHGVADWEPVRQPAVCSIDGCSSPTKAKGFCRAHYWRLRTHGDPLGGRTPEGEPASFLKEVVLQAPADTCVIWPYANNGVGYGVISIDGEMRLVTRVVCEAVNGPPPTDRHEAAHSCGNGHQGCCTPAHLHWATHSENELEKIAHGTHRKGVRHPLAKLSEEQAIQIKSMKGLKTHQQIADDFGIGRVQVTRILSGQRWSHLS